MTTLVIETATAACSVALLDGARVLASAHEQVGRGHAERLLPMIAELLGGDRPHAILVDCGPGSFTGVRVGLAAARALGLGWGVPVAGYSSLALLAAAGFADSPHDRLTVALIGGHGELFVQRFARPFATCSALASLPPPAAAAFAQGDVTIGSGAALLDAARERPPAPERLPAARDAALLPPAYRTLAPVPIYGRAPDAKPAAAA